MTPLAGRGSLVAAAAVSWLLTVAPAAAQQAQLRLVVVAGQDALNNIRLTENRDVIVELQDQNRLPVMGAEVTFILPDAGPGGTFPDGTRSLTVTSDAQGRAVAAGIRPNGETGPLQIRVSATYLGLTATAVVQQTNVSIPVVEVAKPKPAPPPKPAPEPKPVVTPEPAAPATAAPSTTSVSTPATQTPPKKGMSKGAKIFLVLAIAAGAAAAAVLATRDNGSHGGGSTGPPPITITPGTPSVGGPQ